MSENDIFKYQSLFLNHVVFLMKLLGVIYRDTPFNMLSHIDIIRHSHLLRIKQTIESSSIKKSKGEGGGRGAMLISIIINPL
jgi:hypothetical protein